MVGAYYDLVATMSKKKIMKDLYKVLQDMYGEKAVKPEDILIPDWHTNPLFFGSYSNWPIGITLMYKIQMLNFNNSSGVTKKVYENLDAPMGHLYMAGTKI